MTDTNFDLYAEDWAPSYEPPASFEMDGTGRSPQNPIPKIQSVVP